MLTTLIRREFLDNLMTFRFAAAILIMLLLMVANTAVLIKYYEQRLADYNDAVKRHQRQLQEKKTYSTGDMYIDRPPNPLSIFNAGFDKRLGNSVSVSYRSVPSLWDAYIPELDNPFMDMFASMDIVLIFKVILSLLALIFAYGALTGEYESGTLRLVLTHPVPRGYILLAKYISAMLCLLVPLLMSLLLSIILLTTSTAISLNTDDFLRIGGIVLTSVVYLSVFYLIGLLISAATRRTGTALMLSLFIWGFLVLVYPNVILTVIPRPEAPQARTTSAFNQIEQLWEEFDRKRQHFLASDDFPGEVWHFNIPAGGILFDPFIRGNSRNLSYTYRVYIEFEALLGEEAEYEPKVLHAQNYFRFLGPLIIDTAERTWFIRKPALEDIYIKPANVERIWLKFSPAGLYDTATQTWAGTDLLGARDFFDAVRRYRQRVVDYLYDKDAFGARAWFAADRGAADWSNFPQFAFQRVEVETNAKRALPDVFILLMLNVIIFIVIFLIFIKSEV
ncbi:MAG: ABC transporter permease subunit [Candidatus Poribacteria bacterium]|nr:ABC transporter permease subunit [Candidatus Poribacteria bacterium]